MPLLHFILTSSKDKPMSKWFSNIPYFPYRNALLRKTNISIRITRVTWIICKHKPSNLSWNHTHYPSTWRGELDPENRSHSIPLTPVFTRKESLEVDDCRRRHKYYAHLPQKIDHLWQFNIALSCAVSLTFCLLTHLHPALRVSFFNSIMATTMHSLLTFSLTKTLKL